MAVHLTSCLYQLKKGDPRLKGVAVVSEAGLSEVIALLDSKGYPITAPDGGSCDIWQYWLTPCYGAITIPTED